MITTTEGGAYRVSCLDLDCPRPLARTVASMAHAANLERKHLREHHADEVYGDLAEVTELSAIIRAAEGTYPSTTPLELAEQIIAAGWIRAPF